MTLLVVWIIIYVICHKCKQIDVFNAKIKVFFLPSFIYLSFWNKWVGLDILKIEKWYRTY